MPKGRIKGLDPETGKAIKEPPKKKAQAPTSYHVNYRREKLREVRVYIPKGSELEAWINAQGNASGYIKELIEKDKRKRGK